MAARKRIWTPEIVRQRIKTSMLVRRLQDQALKGTQLAEGQQRAIEILLRKVMPDLTHCEYTASDDNRSASDLSTAELDQRIRALEGKALPSPSEPIISELH